MLLINERIIGAKRGNMTTKNTIYLTKKGLKKLRKDLKQLENAYSREMQEFRNLDGGEDHEDRLQRAEKINQLNNLESDISEKKMILENAKLYPSTASKLKVALGSVVDLIDQHGRIVRYTVVDSIEADPSLGLISVASPLGKNLIGRTTKDFVEWTSRIGGKKQLQIVAVH